MAAEIIPFPDRVARRPSRSSAQVGRFEGLTPQKLTATLRDAQRGRLRDWADLCDRMVELDGEIRANYVTRRAALAGARWEMEPGPPTGDPARDIWANAAAEFCAARMREFDDLEVTLMEVLDAIGVGVSLHEKDWVWNGQAWVIERFRFVHQRRLEYGPEWDLRIVDLGDGQRVPGGVPVAAYPGKFVVHEPREHASDPSVAGVLRACAWPYLFTRWATQFWVTGAERFAWPLTLAEVPRNTPEAAREALRANLEAMTAEHVGVLDEGDAVKLLESQVKDNGTWRELIKALNADKAKAILGSVDQSAPSEVGAWKAVESRKATTVDSRQALDERQLAATWRRDVITWLVRYNTHLFGGQEPPIPRMRWVVAEKRREIPSHLIGRGIVTRNQVLRSIGEDPIPGPDGDERV